MAPVHLRVGGGLSAFTPMKPIELDVEPMPCPRPRVRVAGKFARAYYPAPYNNWKDAVARLIVEKRKGRAPLIGPLSVTIRVRCTRPKTSKLQFPKPDSDNYAKSILDACTAAGVWNDDSQVVDLSVFKRWRFNNEPRVVIEITPLPEDEA